MDHANEVALALQKAGADKLTATATAYLYQRLARGVDLDRQNLGGLQAQGFGRTKGPATFPDLGAGARALVATSVRAAPRAWGEITDEEFAQLGRYPLRAVVAGTAMTPDEALKKFHGLTPDAALAAGWTRVSLAGSAGWVPPGSGASFGPVGPVDRLPIPVRDGGIAYLSFADAERAGAVRGADDGAWDLSGVRPVEQANLFAVQKTSLGAWKHAVAGGLAAVFVVGAGVAVAFKYGMRAKPCVVSTEALPPPAADSPTGKWVWIGGGWLPGAGYTCLDGRWQFGPSIALRPRHPSAPNDSGSDSVAVSTICILRGKKLPPSVVKLGVPQYLPDQAMIVYEDGSGEYPPVKGHAQKPPAPPGTFKYPPSGADLQDVVKHVPCPEASSKHEIADETPAQSQHGQQDLDTLKNQILNYQGVSVAGATLGDAPPILPELDITFRGLVADWEGFDRIGVGTGVLPELASDSAAWRKFRDAWKAGTVPAAEIVPGLQAETARATKIRQALRDAAIVDPALQLAVSASNAKAWIDTIPWLAWIFKPAAGPLGAWRIPIVLGGVVVALMILSAIIKGRRGTKIYMLPPPRSG